MQVTLESDLHEVARTVSQSPAGHFSVHVTLLVQVTSVHVISDREFIHFLNVHVISDWEFMHFLNVHVIFHWKAKHLLNVHVIFYRSFMHFLNVHVILYRLFMHFLKVHVTWLQVIWVAGHSARWPARSGLRRIAISCR